MPAPVAAPYAAPSIFANAQSAARPPGQTADEPAYDRDAIFNENGPINPGFMTEAIRTLMRNLPLDPNEPRAWADRRMHSALIGLAALHPRDEIEVMLGVQALSAYHAATACWHIGMNARRPNGDSTRHISTAASAARAFDSMLRALERRQAKPLSVPIGRPAARDWDLVCSTDYMSGMEARCRADPPDPAPPDDTHPEVVWSDEDLAFAEEFREKERIERENEGLDIANTEGILPGGGMILTENPTPQQEAYIARRLVLSYKREYAENLRKGIRKYPKIRAIRPGDLIE